MSALYMAGGVLIGVSSTALVMGYDTGIGFLYVPAFIMIMTAGIMEFNS